STGRCSASARPACPCSSCSATETTHVRSEIEGETMTSTTTGVPPQQQPLRPAIALAIISLVSALMSVLGVVAAWVLAATGIMEGGTWAPSPSDGGGFALAIVVLSLLSLLLLLVGIGIQLASFILSLIVVIRGDGKLRTGAAILLAMSLFGVFFSVTLDL